MFISKLSEELELQKLEHIRLIYLVFMVSGPCPELQMKPWTLTFCHVRWNVAHKKAAENARQAGTRVSQCTLVGGKFIFINLADTLLVKAF